MTSVDTYTSVPSAMAPAPATISVSSVPLGDGRSTSGAAAKYAAGASPPSHYSFNSGVNDISSGDNNDIDQGEDYGGNTLTEPVEETIKRDLTRIVNNLKLVVLPNPFREDPGKALRDWDLWGPFFFVVFLGLALSWSAAIEKSEVFAVAFGVLAGGAVILTLNIVLLGGRINFFQSMSLLGYCLFPLDVGALICLFHFHILTKMWVVFVAMGWSCWAAYPYMSSAVDQKRKALALYPILLLYVSIGFFIIAID